MNITLSKPMIFGLGLTFTLLSGLILSNSGKPYNTLLFTLHKFITVGTLIFFAVTVYKTAKVVDVHTLFMVVFVATGLIFVSMIISGGLLSAVVDSGLSLDEATFDMVLSFHQMMPFVALVVSIISGYLLFAVNRSVS
mgnify:CR=1 FL=1